MLDPMKLAVARRLGIPSAPQPVAPAGTNYADAIDTSLSPRPQRLPLLPQPHKTTLANLPMPGM